MGKKKTSPGSRTPAGSALAKKDSERSSRPAVLLAALTFAGLVLTIAAAPPWAAAAAVAAALATCALHRSVWRPRPAPGGVAIMVAVTAIVGIAAHLAFESTADDSVLEASGGRTLFSHGVGQIESGNIAQASMSGASGSYSDPLVADLGMKVTVALRLHNGGPDELTGTRVTARIPNGAASSLSIRLVARPRNAHPPSTGDTATVQVKGGGPGCVTYVPGSTSLYDQHFGLIKNLPDGITGEGVPIGTVGVSLEQIRFVSLDLDLVGRGESGCA